MSRIGAIPAEDVLGDNYNITNISVSNYNPSIDGTVTVTVTVKDVYGDAVSGETVLVTASAGNFTKYNGSTITGASSYTGTTNSSGQFTLTYTCSEWGIINFSANNHIAQIRVDGWKQVTLSSGSSYGILYVNGAERLAFFRYSRQFGSVSGGSVYTWHTGAIPSAYRPAQATTGAFNYIGTLIISPNGDIMGVMQNNDTGSSKTYNASAMWIY